jgi:glycosyltransferase involved in cell wall biosynthesis
MNISRPCAATDGIAAPERARLLFVITEDWFFTSHFLERGAAAVREGYEVAVATRPTTKVGMIESHGMRVIPIDFSRRGLNPLRELRTALQLRRIVREFKPSIIHNIALKPVVTGTFGELLAGATRIVNAPVGMGHVFTADSDRSKLIRPVLQFLLRRLLNPRGSVVIIENEDDLRELLEGGFVHSDAIRLVPGAGVDIDKFVPRPEPAGPVTVLLVARILRDKGVLEFVESARRVRARHPGTRFLIVGSPDDGNPSSLRESDMRRWEEAGDVQCLGFREDVAELLSAAHIACLPSYREGLPKSLLEAAAAGKPIVTTNVPGCRTVAIDGVNGLLVPARDPEALAHAISRLVADPQLRARLGRAGREKAELEFASALIVDQTLDIYREMMDR